MNNLLWALIFLLLSLLFAIGRKVYLNYLPDYELKRQAQKHELPAAELYKAAAYSRSLYMLLDLRLGIMTAATLVLLVESSLNPWASWLVALLILGLLFWLIPSSPVTKAETWLTLQVSPIFLWFLSHLHNPLDRLSKFIEPLDLGQAKGSPLFEKQDLINLIKTQSTSPPSRLYKQDLNAAIQALVFNDQIVAEILTPLKSVKAVLASDTLGPILIDEIHKSGQSQVLVKDKKKGQIVGSLSFSQLGLDSTGKVEDVMDDKVYYLNEKDSLSEVIRAYFKTSRSLFVVVNNAQEMIGVVSVKDAIEKLIGASAATTADDFEAYTNLPAVAARHDSIDATEAEAEESSVKTDDKMVE